MLISPFTICTWLWCAMLIIWLVWSVRAKPTQSREGISSRMSYTVLTIAGVYLMFSRNVPRDWLRIPLFTPNMGTALLGIALTAAGLGLAIWARAYLGDNWSGTITVKVGHELVRTGPYRWVRHPIYSGLLLAMVGTGLEVVQLRALVSVVLLYMGFKIKSKVEEQAMIATFGSGYETYAAQTGAILPRLRR
jgi:protein-S-isoprenylcysteine O-methyltransferase Ste14